MCTFRDLAWASYLSERTDLSRSDLEVTGVYGGRDGVLDRENLAEARVRLPASTVYVEVEGATHAHFVDHGPQSGDGEPPIPRPETRAEIVDASNDLVNRIDFRRRQASANHLKPDARSRSGYAASCSMSSEYLPSRAALFIFARW